jgi:hypothetical protein
MTHRKGYKNEYYKKIRAEIIQLLGGKCTNPFNLPHPDWCNDTRCLQIDHVNGGGIKEKKRVTNGGQEYYGFVLRQIKLGSKDYQLLCANCNWIKRHENNENRKT